MNSNTSDGTVIDNNTVDKECFVIMPISDNENYETEHFKRVYEDIFKPACEIAGYKAIRADDIKKTNLIHLDILNRLLKSDMAICDLSSKNPNVLFELGIRQAFDKPTVLVKDVDTNTIFDIAPLKYYTYNKSLMYRNVLEDQKEIAKFLAETEESCIKNDNINSIVKLLSLNKATISEKFDDEGQISYKYIISELNELRRDIRKVSGKREPANKNQDFRYILLLLDELREMISNGTSLSIIKQNYIDINSKIQNISDGVVRSMLFRELENINKEIELIS